MWVALDLCIKELLINVEKMIAVKVLNLLNHGASKSFLVECEALRNIRHRNLVKVLTSCSRIIIKVMILKLWYMSS